MESRIPQNNLVSQPAVTDGHGFMGSTSNNATQGNQGVEFLAGYDDGGRRHSFPDHSPKKGEQRDKRSFSDAKRNIKRDDPLAKTILDRLDLLEGLSRCLDKEYKYGTSRCWKHIAEHFKINEEKYQSFKCSNIHSPTEAMFEYLQTSHPEITVGKLKDKLRSIERQDVIDVLVACEKINDGTLVSSLFNSNPDIIGRVAFLLDGQKVGLETWVQLAEKFGIPKDVSKSFETCTNYNPTDGLFEYLTIHLPKMTVEELITHLKAMHRLDVVTAIEESDEVESGSSVKDLVEDLLVMEKVCELLNLKFRIKKVLGWRHLGARLKIKKDILDALSPPEEDFEGPTAALIRYLGSWKPYLKIGDFFRALEKIDRLDVIDVFKGYLPGGCDSEPL